MKFSALKIEGCAAREQGRYAMHGVKVERDASRDAFESSAPDFVVRGARAVATDGRKLAVLPVTFDAHEREPGRCTIIPTEAFKLARKVAGARKPAHVALAGDGAEPDLRAGGERFATLEGEYPRYAAVIPQIAAGSKVVLLNPDYIRELCDAIAPVDSDGSRSVAIVLPPSSTEAKSPGPVLFVSLAEGGGVGAVMPMTRGDDVLAECIARVEWARANPENLRRPEEVCAAIAAAEQARKAEPATV